MYGFRKVFHPFVYLSKGKLIGDHEMFSDYCKTKYGVSKEENDISIILKLTNDNIKKANKEYKLVIP